MTRPAARHPRCGGVWRGPLHTDRGTVLVCNTCGEEHDVTEPADLQWLTQQQAADRLQVHVRTVERHRASGRLPTYRATPGGAPRFRVQDVDALMQPDSTTSSTA